MTVKKCPECGTRRSLRSTVALWAGRIVLICIAGVISTLSGLSAGDAFFRRPLNASHPRGVNQSRIKRATHWRAAKVMSWEERALLPKLIIHKVLQNVSAQTHVDQSKG